MGGLSKATLGLQKKKERDVCTELDSTIYGALRAAFKGPELVFYFPYSPSLLPSPTSPGQAPKSQSPNILELKPKNSKIDIPNPSSGIRITWPKARRSPKSSEAQPGDNKNSSEIPKMPKKTSSHPVTMPMLQ